MAMADMKFLWCGVSYKEVLPQEKWGIVENFLQSYLKYTMLANEKGSKLNTGKFFREYREGIDFDDNRYQKEGKRDAR